MKKRRPNRFTGLSGALNRRKTLFSDGNGGKDRAFAKARKVCLAESEFPQGIGISAF
ncbi:hypothetical protein [Papillibacter cinnamivorans]|uniref:hypothetical protein n=1 Tax=Papillibacter cinnamivorans TaxID=100176 RepID=UPI0013566A2A|nr:hypothetical protein [Papillibacter cinnamivorans]